MGRKKDKLRKETVTFRIAQDTDNRIETLRKTLIQSNVKRSLFGGSPIKATRSDMVEQGIADLYSRKAYEYEHGAEICGYCKQSRNQTEMYNSAVEELERYIGLYDDMKKLYSSSQSVNHGLQAKEAKL